MTKVNIDELLGYLDRDLTDALERSIDERREHFGETEVLRVLLQGSFREGSDQEYKLLQLVAPSIARAVHRTVTAIAFADAARTVAIQRRNLPPRLRGWIDVPDRVAR